MAYNFVTTKRIESTECPGASFVIKRVTEADRTMLREQNMESSATLRELGVRIKRLSARAARFGDEIAEKKKPDMEAVYDNEKELASILDETDSIVIAKLRPQWIEMFLVAIEGLEIDGTPVTKADVAKGPPELFNEIIGAIRAELGVGETELKNLLPPSTSEEPEIDSTKTRAGSKRRSTTASSVKEIGSTGHETAADTSPS